MRQRGMAVVLTLIFLPVFAAGIAWLAAGPELMRRFEGHTVADRVAFSTAAQLASELNEMSILNRKILASHLMVAHLTTYLSFTRYLKDIVDSVSYILPFGHSFIAGGTTLLVETAKLQLQGGIGVALGMQHTWAFQSAEILLNGGSRVMAEAESVDGGWGLEAVCVARFCGRAALDTVLHGAVPVIEEDPADYSRLSMQALSGLPQAAWHLGRNWQQNVLGLFEARRRGATASDFTGRGWKASESLKARVKLFFFGFGWKTLADGAASTVVDGFVYRGLPWLLEWHGPSVIPLRVALKHPTAGRLEAESRTRFMGSGDTDLWRPVWRSELTGGA